MKLPQLWKPTDGSCFHVYLKKRKVNLRTRDAKEADRLRRALVAGTLTPETIPGAPGAGSLSRGDNAGGAALVVAAFERAPEFHPGKIELTPPPPPAFVPDIAPKSPQGPQNGPQEAFSAGGGTSAPGAGTVAPDAYTSPDGWASDLHDAAGGGEGAEGAAENVAFDGGQLLDFAANLIAEFTENLARSQLAKRGRAAPPLPEDFPLKKLLADSWSAQLKIWCPTDAAMTPGTGIAIGTIGLWGIMVMGSQPATAAEPGADSTHTAPSTEAMAA